MTAKLQFPPEPLSPDDQPSPQPRARGARIEPSFDPAPPSAPLTQTFAEPLSVRVDDWSPPQPSRDVRSERVQAEGVMPSMAPQPMAAPQSLRAEAAPADDWALPPDIEADMRAKMAPQVMHQAPAQEYGSTQEYVPVQEFTPSATADAGYVTPGLDLPPPVPAKRQKKAKTSKTARTEQGSLKKNKSGRQMRRGRRRRRVWFEELMGWVFVPVILYAVYWASVSLLALFGKTPQEVIEGLTQVYRGFH